MQQPKKLVTVLFLALPMMAEAGEPITTAPQPATNPGDWCQWLQSKPGQVKFDNPYIQSIYIGGRLQWQASYVDGEDVNGNGFSDADDEYRRARIESKIEFLRFLTLKTNIDMVVDDRKTGGDLDWGYQQFDEALLTFDIKKAFGAGALDSLKVNYGRHKLNVSEEARTSSKEIITIERSAISNKVYNSARPTGITVDAAQGAWNATLGLFSGDSDSEFIDGWHDGNAFYAAFGYQMNDQLRFDADLLINNSDNPGANRFNYDWATTFNATYEQDRFGFLGSIIIGENENTGNANRDGSFYGVVAMPWYWIVEEKLQAVLQYQYAASDESEGIRLNSRYVRASEQAAINSGRGDSLHTIYAGLNYYLCGHNAKIMAGVEYSTLDTPAGDVNTITTMVAFRTFF